MIKLQFAHIKARMLWAAVVAVATLAMAATASAAPLESTTSTASYHRVRIDCVGIFYLEAGPRNAPTIVLLHGFPSSSREFDTLIPLLAPRYHVIAPDSPGFGQSDAPAASAYACNRQKAAKPLMFQWYRA